MKIERTTIKNTPKVLKAVKMNLLRKLENDHHLKNLLNHFPYPNLVRLQQHENQIIDHRHLKTETKVDPPIDVVPIIIARTVKIDRIRYIEENHMKERPFGTKGQRLNHITGLRQGAFPIEEIEKR